MRNIRIASAFIALIVAAACGSSDSPSTPTTPTPPAQTNRAPVINSLAISPGFGIHGLTIFTYSASASDLDGDPVTYTWDIAGNAATGSSGGMLFSAGGNGTARVTVTDGKGGSVTDTRPFVVGSMSGAWLITSGQLAGASFNLTQTNTGVVTGSFFLPGIGNGNTDPAQPGRIDANGVLTMRVKVAPFTDFNMAGTMTQTGQIVSGSLQGSGFTGQPFTMAK